MPLSVITDKGRSGPREPLRAQGRTWLTVGSTAVRRRPPVFTLALIACIVTTFIRLEVGGRLPMIIYDAHAYSPRSLVEGRLSTLGTSTIMTNYIWMVVSISASLLVTLGTYEVMAGHLRAVIVAIVAAVLGPVGVTAGLGLLFALGSQWADTRLGTLDIGASAIIAMASGAAAGVVRDRRLTIGLILFLIGGLLTHHRIADWEHVIVFPAGYLMARLVGVRPVRRSWHAKGRSPWYLLVGTGLLIFGVLTSGVVLPAPPVLRNSAGMVLSPARLVDTTYPSPALGGQLRRVAVLLPAGYDNTHGRYPVVEVLHGHPGHPADLFSTGDVQNSSADPGVAPFIAVAPDGNGPQIEDSWFVNLRSQKMGTATTTDLRTWVAQKYRTTASWSYAGLSSGGYGAAYLPQIDPLPVHAVCGLSGRYDGSKVPVLVHAGKATQRRASPIHHLSAVPRLVFLAYGRADARTRRFTIPYAAALRRAHHHVVLATYPGKHQWSVWRPAFRDCFRTILPAVPTSGPGN